MKELTLEKVLTQIHIRCEFHTYLENLKSPGIIVGQASVDEEMHYIKKATHFRTLKYVIQ